MKNTTTEMASTWKYFKRHYKNTFLILLVFWALWFLHLYLSAGLGSGIKYKLRGNSIFNPPIQEEKLRTRVPKHEQASTYDNDVESGVKSDSINQSTYDIGQIDRHLNIQALRTYIRAAKTKYDWKKILIDDGKHSPRNIDKDKQGKKANDVYYQKRNTTRHSNVHYRHSNAKMITYKDIVFPEPDCDGKFLIYVCSTGDKCGGLADRQKGMMSAFLLALMTDRTLLILADYPCDITQYVRPNVYDWTKCWTHVHKYVNHSQLEIKTYNAGRLTKFTFPNDLERYHGDDLWDEHVVKVHVNTRFQTALIANRMVRKKMPWIAQIPEERIIKNVMEILFKSSKKLQNQVSKFLRTHVQDRPLVCGHIRIGQNPTLGRHKDEVFMNSTNAVRLLKIIREIHRSTPGSVIFLSSDSDDVKVKARGIIKDIVLFNGRIEHMDRLRSKTCSGTNTAFVEQQILSTCDTLLLTGSGFSRMAAFIGGKATRIYITETRRSTDIKVVTLRDLYSMPMPIK